MTTSGFALAAGTLVFDGSREKNNKSNGATKANNSQEKPAVVGNPAIARGNCFRAIRIGSEKRLGQGTDASPLALRQRGSGSPNAGKQPPAHLLGIFGVAGQFGAQCAVLEYCSPE